MLRSWVGSGLLGVMLAGASAGTFASDAAVHFGLNLGGSSVSSGVNASLFPIDFGRFYKHRNFQRISTLGNYLNNDNIGDETVSEIVAATADGMTLAYTDGSLEALGFIDISNPGMPTPDGKVELDGEPTSVDILGDRYALVGVNTSPSFTAPSGHVAVIDIASRTIVRTLGLRGQPDSMKISPDGRYCAVVIENERDEDVTVGGVEGGLPQLPPGGLQIIDITDPSMPSSWTTRSVALAGLSAYAPTDPEPEFVDVNDQNQAVISLQENNHLVIVDLVNGTVTGDFAAGEVSLSQIDNKEDGVIDLTDSISNVAREPDAITWLPGGNIGTANEGDLFGGSRGFSIFDQAGNLRFDAGNRFEHSAVRFGHYPEDRSENKGAEPEAIEYGNFSGTDYLFVGSERGSFINVYELNGSRPRFKQILPGPLGPEGLLAIPSRNLLIASGEEDDPSYGVRSSVMIYQLQRGKPSYPQIYSAERNGVPIPWSALSGMVALPSLPWRDQLLAVQDAYYSQPHIFLIDAYRKPAVITRSWPIRGGTGNYDPEGIALAPDGTIWVASEGNASDSRPNRLLQLDWGGNVMQEIGLPQAVLNCRADTRQSDDDNGTDVGATFGSGFEGVAVHPHPSGKAYSLLVAQQRGWNYANPRCEDLDDDAGGLDDNGQPNRTRIWTYNPANGEWGHIAWELAAVPQNASWVGLSEITRTPNGRYVLIERDNRTGDFAEIKNLVRITKDDVADDLVEASEKETADLIGPLLETKGWITDKPEGLAISATGKTYLVTDNDGVDDWSGETWFLNLGNDRWLFGGPNLR